MTATSSNTSATIARAALGSVAAAHSDGDKVSQILMADSDRFYAFLFAEMGRLLNMWRVQQGTGTVDVSAHITSARMFGDDRNEILGTKGQSIRTRKVKFIPTRRPRRRI
jgi:hypothetical protein